MRHHTLLSCNPKFCSTILFDLGASKKNQGHLRLVAFNDDFQPVGDILDVPVSEQGFKNGRQLAQMIGSRVAEFWKAISMLLDPSDKVESVIAFAPETPQNGILDSIYLLETDDGRDPGEIDLNLIQNELVKQDVPVSGDYRLIVFNDSFGGAAALASMLAQDQEHQHHLKPGKKITYMAAGGGLGKKDLIVQEDGVHLVSTVRSNNKDIIHQIVGSALDKAGVAELIRNFCSPLSIPVNIQNQLVGEGDGRVVTSFERAQEYFPHITQEDYYSAADYAIGQFIDGVVTYCYAKALTGTDVFVLSGLLSAGISQYLEERIDGKLVEESDQLRNQFNTLSGKTVLESLILGGVYQRLEASEGSLAGIEPLELVTSLSIPHNIEGWRVLLNATLDSNIFREGSYRIPLTSLTDPSVSLANITAFPVVSPLDID